MITSKGTEGEKLVEDFFDKKFSKLFSFPNAKTKNNAQVADVLVWLNRSVILIEVKTRDEGHASLDDWAHYKIKQSIDQLKTNYQRIKSCEQIFLNNSFYHTQLDCEGLYIIGLIVLVHENEFDLLPSSKNSDVYNQEFPIHVLSMKDLFKMTEEIDTVPDLFYYLNDRFKYLKIADIPLCNELDALGYYKSKSNKFPSKGIDFSKENCWMKYKHSMRKQINLRNQQNQHSSWLDSLEKIFNDQRKLYDNIPFGLYFAWELGALSRRQRALLGEKLTSVEQWFQEGKSSRKFAWQNTATDNWLLFYFSKLEQKEIEDALINITRLKLIKEIHYKKFDQGIYSFGFQVTTTYPHRLLGLASAIIYGVDEVTKNYTKEEIELSNRIWGGPNSITIKEIFEFPQGEDFF